MSRLFFLIKVLVCLPLLVSCGGGEDGLPDVEAARVSLGDNRTVNEQQVVTISATANPSGGNYTWTFSGSANSADIQDFVSDGAQASFTAPAGVGTQVYQITVKYTSPGNKVATDSVEITVKPVNTIPLAVPSLQSPSDSVVPPGTNVILSATQSSDIDGTIESYRWEQVGGAPAISPTDGTASLLYQFVAPEVTNKTSFIFRLTVTDNEGGTDDAEITLVVDPTIVTHDVSAGPDMVVNEEQMVTLSATAIPAGGTFFWTTTSGELTANFPSTSQTLTFQAPATTVEKVYDFTVEYRAPDGEILLDTVAVRVKPVNRLPVAAIRVTSPSSLPAEPGQVVVLDPSSSYDRDINGEIVNYVWTPIGNAPAFTVNTNHELSFTAPATVFTNAYVFQLEVTDNEGGKASITQEIKVSGTNELNVANAGLDQTVKEHSMVTVDGSDSIILTGGSLTCTWRQISGPAFVFPTTNVCQLTFQAPNVDVTEIIVLELVVNGPATDTVSIEVLPLSLGTLNDTGVTNCFDYTNAYGCTSASVSSYPSQDGQTGRDANLLDAKKTGTSMGNNAFDFTLLDENGDEIAGGSSVQPQCVRDNVTGLIWELKQSVSGLRLNTDTYTWFYPDGSTGGNDGVAAPWSSSCAAGLSTCGLDSYVSAINDSVYCGGANWRVPSVSELQSIVNYGLSNTTGVVDTLVFKDLPTSGSPSNLYYWTSETSAEGGGESSSWVIDFLTGDDNILPKLSTSRAHIRLVRNP